MSLDGPSKTKNEKKETNTINPKTVIAIKMYVRSMFFILMLNLMIKFGEVIVLFP